VLRFADVLSSTPADVPDDLYGALLQLVGEAGIVELASAIAWENYRARFNRAFNVEAEGFCLLPPPTFRGPRPSDDANRRGTT